VGGTRDRAPAPSRARRTAVRALPVAAAAGMVALACPPAAPAAVSHARPATAVPDISRPIQPASSSPRRQAGKQT